jgi:hypothetical protein
MSSYPERFMALFSGLTRAYGTFEVNATRERDGKKTGRVTSIQKNVTAAVWAAHLSGEKTLGIIPIRDDSTVLFGAIDIDQYNIDVSLVAQAIDKFGMPLVACRSKSGGVHAYLFLEEAASAALVQAKLREMASVLGFGSAEVFPKQTVVLPERGDIGSWINMPYFHGMVEGRTGITTNGEHMPIDDFLAIADIKKCSLKEINEWKAPVSDEFKQGPPCLQILTVQGFPTGTRNNGLYNLGVYAKKAFPDAWEAIVEQYNVKYMETPLSANEVKELIKSLKKKEYQYTCAQVPLVSFCNAVVCRGRKYGVGDSSGMPVITGLTKFCSTPPIWFADIDTGGRLELSTEDLQQQSRFQKRCMEVLNSMPGAMNAKAWQAMIQGHLENVTLIESPQDATPRGQLTEMVDKFCTQRAQALTKDEIRLGRPFTENGKHYFTTNGLMAFLERHKFKALGLHEVTSFLKNDLGATHKFFNIKGKGINAWELAELSTQDSLETPATWKKEGPF